MSDGDRTSADVLSRSHNDEKQMVEDNIAGRRRRTSSTTSTHSQALSRGFQIESKTPLTPEESPPFRETSGRSAQFAKGDTKHLDKDCVKDTHSRANSSDSDLHVCICQPDPKIPRPRNAFILYRQHHQANVVAQNPGLANPDISRIIGDQWNNLPPEVKDKWKALGEDEKLRHQQQYPDYRYQPKRNGRHNSHSNDLPTSAGKCARCGGRSLVAPSTPHAAGPPYATSPSSIPATPGSASGPTPITRTLPVLRDLDLQSPATRRPERSTSTKMLAHHNGLPEERDDVGPLSPDKKRRRYNTERIMPPRYANLPTGTMIGPGTPFPFGHPAPTYQHAASIVHPRRESLPGLRGIMSSAIPMAPPPSRPGMGYQQHRMSQGHISHDRSLILPPLQTGNGTGPSGTAAAATAAMSVEEQIMSISFRYKIKILSQVAKPAPIDKRSLRGPLIAVEGDDAEAVAQLGKWLSRELSKGDGLSVQLIDGPNVFANEDKKPMSQYHWLVSEWLAKSDDIQSSMTYAVADTPMSDAPAVDHRPTSLREIDEDYDDGDPPQAASSKGGSEGTKNNASEQTESMDIDTTPASSSKKRSSIVKNSKPISIIANYSLHASNIFACRISVGPNDPYSPSDHWQWTATQWRGIVGPDLTIFLRDSVASDTGKATVEMLEEGNLFVVKRTRSANYQGLELEAPALRRLGFEVSEWVRAFEVEQRGRT